MSEKTLMKKMRYGKYHNYSYDAIQDTLFHQLPEAYIELQPEDMYHKEHLDMIHEKLSRAYYEDTLTKIMTQLLHEPWMNTVIGYSEGNIGALNVLMELDKYPFRHGSSEEILAMLLTMNLTGSKLWIYYKDCCGQNWGNIEKIFITWIEKRISINEILSHMKDGYGTIIRTELL